MTLTTSPTATSNRPVVIRSNREIRDYSLVIFDRTFAITHVLRLLVVIVAFVGVFSALMAIQLDRQHEYAVLRALGFRRLQLVQLILVGQPELREKLASPKLVQFAQRVSSDFHLNSMSKLAVREYIDFRMLTSGATRNVFTEDAAAAIHEATGGVPRLINQLCDYSLLYAFGEGVYRVDRNMIETVVEDRNVNGSFAPVSSAGPSGLMATSPVSSGGWRRAPRGHSWAGTSSWGGSGTSTERR